MSSLSYVHTVKSAKFTIDGTSYNISSVVFEASINGIPSCTIGIAPNSNTNLTTVDILSISSLADTYKQLIDKANNLAKAELLIEFDINVAHSIRRKWHPKLELKNWILKDVGLSRVTTTQGFSLLCTIVHPVYKLTLRTGFLFTGKGVVDFSGVTEGVTDPIDAAKKCIDATIAANQEQGTVMPPTLSVGTSVDFKNQNQVTETVSTQLEEALADLGHLTWDATTYANANYSIPCESIVQNIDSGVTAMKYVLVEAWAQGMSESLWSALIGTICPAFGLEVIPTYDQTTLTVSPRMPWCKKTVELPDWYVASILFPGRDPTPIFGYIIYDGEPQTPANPSIVMEEGMQENIFISLSSACFIPKTANTSLGRLVHCSRPGWIDLAIQRAASLGKKPIVLSGAADYSDTFSEKPEVPSGDNKDMEAWNAVVFAYLNDMFLSEYRQNVTAELSCPFLPQYNDEPLYPGTRVTIMTSSKGSDGEDDTLFSGRLVSIRHTIDVASSSATTNLSLAYCVSGKADSILGDNVQSPFYGASGKVDDD